MLTLSCVLSSLHVDEQALSVSLDGSEGLGPTAEMTRAEEFGWAAAGIHGKVVELWDCDRRPQLLGFGRLQGWVGLLGFCCRMLCSVKRISKSQSQRLHLAAPSMTMASALSFSRFYF